MPHITASLVGRRYCPKYRLFASITQAGFSKTEIFICLLIRVQRFKNETINRRTRIKSDKF